MSGYSAITTPISLLTPAARTPALGAVQMSASETARRAAIKKTATDFEASFLSTMMSQMFDGVQTSAPFGGGEGEQAYKSFMVEAYAKQMAARGGVGVAAAVQREMLKMQGLSQE
ncbi:rod-binding protein [Phenylobacterium montanum]|uniref:Rod-binding protein n=1 Tax=Phenylobacterium montanum TaxID=2823693 RepID=A0A975G1G2_9CAUL|nr:rod-binding protein [Caulobacter sp. S6]QUD89140.1 rod-binding protein [Caulobacter sp. S6]